MKTVDPEPSLVFFVDTGVHTIFPDDRNFLFNQAGADAGAERACPPRSCNYKKSTNGFAGPCNQNADPQTSSPKNG